MKPDRRCVVGVRAANTCCRTSQTLLFVACVCFLWLFAPRADAQVKAPPNATVSGSVWYCNNGYKQVGDLCEAVKAPPNATVSGSVWYCNNGYKQVGDLCEAVKAPPNATVSGSVWYCNNGYKQVGDLCEAVKAPPNATVSGSVWYCNNGYKQVGDLCEAVKAPPNATVSGSVWYCNNGYKRVGDACVPMTPEELAQQEEARRWLAQQKSLDDATVWESRINRDSGDVIVLENGGVVKVTSGYVGYIGYRKNAVLFKVDMSWKIWIEGKRVFPCDLLKRPTESPTAASRLTIDTVASSGGIIVTTNGSVFRVSWDQATSSIWLSGATVVLLGESRMLNLNAGQLVEVSRIR